MFFSSRIHRKLPRRFGALVLSGALVASFAGFALGNPASATAPGTNYAENKDCADFAPDGVTWQEFKIDGSPKTADSPYLIPDTDLKIEIPTASSQTFDWTSNFDMSAILVKGSSGGIHYQYPGASDKADTGLHAVVHDETKDEMYHAISHVSFCFVVVDTDELDEPVIEDEPETPVDLQPAVTPPAPEVVAAQPEAIETTVLGETLVRGDTLPRTGAAATHTLALAGGLGLALGLMMLMLANRKTAVQNS